MDQEYLGFIRLVKDEKEHKIVLLVPEKIATGCDVDKAFHEDMPQSIKAILLDYKDIFPTDLPLGLPPVRMGHEFKIELEDDTPPIHRSIYNSAHSTLKRQGDRSNIFSSMGTSDHRYPLMEPWCCLHQRRTAVFGFVSITID